MRTVKEWVGRTDNSMPPDTVKDRFRERQGQCCALSGAPLRPGTKVEYDHIVPLWLGGSNTESNLQAVTKEAHKGKTASEAKVRAKCNSIRKKHTGITTAKSSLSKSPFKRLMDGTVVRRDTGEIVGGNRT